MTDYQIQSTYNLVSLAKDNDEWAYRELINRILPNLTDWAFSLVYAPAEIETSLTNAIEQIWRHRHLIDLERSFIDFIKAVLLTNIINSVMEGNRSEEHLVTISNSLRELESNKQSTVNYGRI